MLCVHFDPKIMASLVNCINIESEYDQSNNRSVGDRSTLLEWAPRVSVSMELSQIFYPLVMLGKLIDQIQMYLYYRQNTDVGLTHIMSPN